MFVPQFLLDIVVVGSGWAFALVISNITVDFKRSDLRSAVMILVATTVTMTVFRRRGLYASRPVLPRTDEISRVLTAVLAGASIVAVTAAFLDWHIGAKELVFGGVLVFCARTFARGMARALASERPTTDGEKVVIVGTGEEAKELIDLIEDHPEARFQVAGVIGNLSVAERCNLTAHWLGPTSRLTELMHLNDATGAIVTSTGFRGEQFRSITRALIRLGYDVHLTTGISRMGEGRFSIRSLSHEPLVVMEQNRVPRWHHIAKRLIDIVGSSVALLIFLPLIVLTTIAIWLEDRGSIIYKSSRVGRRSKLFAIYKFRSMVSDADKLKALMETKNERTGPLFKVSNDPRITRVGKLIRETSIDEIPQFINVLKGDMSLIGPRPALPEEQAQFDEELLDRVEVRPGITGLWQVEARSNAAFNAYRRLDLHYVENWTLSLDFQILLATIEQFVVSLTMLGLRPLRRRGSSGTDAIAAPTAPVKLETRPEHPHQFEMSDLGSGPPTGRFSLLPFERLQQAQSKSAEETINLSELPIRKIAARSDGSG